MASPLPLAFTGKPFLRATPFHWGGLRAIAVAPHARGRGIGRRLAQAAIARLRGLGKAAVCLHTVHFMRATVPLYESLGFRRCPGYDQGVTARFGVDSTGAAMMAIGYCLPLEP